MTDYPFNANKPVKADTITNFCVYTEQNAEHLYRALFGFVRRPKFRWKDADEIYIGPGCYHHGGSTRDRLCWWNSELTYKFGSGGDNAHSDDLGNNQWHYLFIYDDHVNVLASNELTATCFSNDTTAPTWSDTYHGWYTGNNRCIGAFRTSGAGAILEFFNDGGNDIFFADKIANSEGAVDSDTTWTDMTFIMPPICNKALVNFYCNYPAEATPSKFLWRTNGQAGTSGHRAASTYFSGSDMIYQAENTTIVFADSSGKIEVKSDVSSTASIEGQIDAYYLPVGM